MAEGFLRRRLEAEGGEAVEVASAGTAGWDGSPAMPEAVEAAAGRETDISGHRARRLAAELVENADLALGMTTEHRDRAVWLAPDAAGRAFTLKELVRLLEALPQGSEAATLQERVAAADELRRSGFRGNPHDEDVVDPLGLPLATYRAVAWELDELMERLVAGLVGRTEAAATPAPAE